MQQKLIRWGILGTAGIARKNWDAIRHTGNSRVAAVASRDLERSRRFIAECQAVAPQPEPPAAFGSYEALLASPEVDAVYLPLPTGVRREWVLRAAAAGKHLVCEKPCASSVADLGGMLEACRRNRVQFMDGVMFVHSRRMERLREVLREGSAIGEVRRITSQFSFLAPPEFLVHNIRADSALEPAGCVGDLGWYSIRFALEVLAGRLPREVTGRMLGHWQRPGSQAPVPAEFTGEMFYEGGVTAGFYSSFVTENQEWASVSGTRGHLHLTDFVLPFAGEECGFEINQPVFGFDGCRITMTARPQRISVPEASNNHPTAQETNLFRNFAAQITTGTLNETWPERALQTQRVLEACLESARQGGRPVGLA